MDARQYIAKRIREFRVNKLNMTAQALGQYLDPPRSGKTICSWETERTHPDAEALIQLCRVFDVPISAFYPDEYSSAERSSEESYINVPLYGSIAAGTPLAIIPIDDTHPIPIEMFRKFPQGFLLKVEGESMNKVLPNGSYAFIDPAQTVPRDDEVYALSMNRNDATIKRVRKLANGIELIPDSHDPTYKPLIYDYATEDPDEIVIIGRVVWMMLPFDWEI